jgi:hypothetical protein
MSVIASFRFIIELKKLTNRLFGPVWFQFKARNLELNLISDSLLWYKRYALTWIIYKKAYLKICKAF